MQQPAQCQLVRAEPFGAQCVRGEYVRAHCVRALRVGAVSVGAVVHNFVPSLRLLVLVLGAPPVLIGASPLLVLTHAGASMAIRSAAIPREPYALTDPSDIPRVSATWASVMSAK